MPNSQIFYKTMAHMNKKNGNNILVDYKLFIIY